MKARMVKVGDYEVIALLYEKKDESPLDVVYYAKHKNVPELMYLQEGDKKDFKTFGEDYAKELIDMFSNKVDFKADSLAALYETDNRMYFMNGQEEIDDEGEEMYYTEFECK